MAGVFDRYQVIDVDTHVTEPPDVWTSRVSRKWGDLVPHIVRMGTKDMWMIGDKPVLPPGITATAGFDGMIPDFPDTYDDAVFPHPTSMSPGPKSIADPPAEYADRVLGGLSEQIIRNVLHDNAARVYHLD